MPVKRSKEKEPAVPKQIEDLKKLYSDRLSSNLSRANATLITWISALLLILITTLIPLSTDLRTKFEHKTSVIKNQQQLDEEEDELNQIKSEEKPDQVLGPPVNNKVQSNSNRTPPSPSGGNQNTAAVSGTPTNHDDRVEEQSRDVAREKNDVENSSEDLDKIKNEMAEIPLPFGKLPIRKIYSPVLWAALFAGFIGFFLFIRIRIFSMLARIIDIHRVSGKLPEEFEGLGTGIPFWLAPLPKLVKKQSTEEVISRGDLEHFLGWKRDSLRNSAVTITWLLLGFFLAGNVVYAIYRSLKLVWSDSPTLGVAIFVATAGLCLIALFSTIFWLMPRIELQGFSTRVIGRRYFIAGAGAVLAVSAAVLLTPEKYLYRTLLKRVPRFRRRQRHLFGKEFRNQFLSPLPSKPSIKERLVYYAGANLFSSHVYKFAKGRKNNAEFLSRFDNVEVIPREKIIEHILALPVDSGHPEASAAAQPALRVVPRQFSAVVECLALEQVKAGNIDRAMELLWEGIHGDRHTGHPGCRKFMKHPDYRLYDLLAGLAFKYSNDGYKQNMIRHIEDNWYNNVRMLERVEKWKNPSKRWTSRWAKEKPLNWKHPFVNWKDASRPRNSAYAEYLI